jgi:medium-chain acyl-[acyl-carrier-protein] hydrolase
MSVYGGAAYPVELHCFPYAGGGASTYRGWQSKLPLGLRVRAVQLPGHEERFGEPPLASFDAVMAHLAETLLPSLREPYALFGHSMGALIAFEVARELQRRGGPLPAWLFVSGMNAPQSARPDDWHLLPDADLLALLRRLGGTSHELLEDRSLQSLFLPLVRQDFALSASYRYREDASLPCPLSVWGGDDDPTTTVDGLEGWRAQTTSAFRLRMLAGTHMFVHLEREALVAGLAEDLRRLRSLAELAIG